MTSVAIIDSGKMDIYDCFFMFKYLNFDPSTNGLKNNCSEYLFIHFQIRKCSENIEGYFKPGTSVEIT